MNASADGQASGGPARPEGLVGAALGFVAIAIVFGLVVAAIGLRIGENDVSALRAELLPDLEQRPLPLGLEWKGGSAMAGESRWLVFERAVAAGPEPGAATWPERIVVGRFGDALPARRLFDPVLGNVPRDLSEDLERWREKPYRFEAVTRRETLAFGTHETDWLVLRTFEEDGSFHDTVRVDLTVGRVGQVLEARWPRGYEGADATVLVPFLERLVLPTPSAEPAAAAAAGAGG